MEDVVGRITTDSITEFAREVFSEVSKKLILFYLMTLCWQRLYDVKLLAYDSRSHFILYEKVVTELLLLWDCR